MISNMFTSQASFQRPANTTAYTAKDVVNGSVAAPLEFPFVTPMENMAYWIMSPVLLSNNAPDSTGSFKLLLFRSPPTTPVDNAVFAASPSELRSLVGVVVFNTAIKISTGTIYVQNGFSPIWGLCEPGQNRIWGVLIDDAGYTPASGEVFTIVLNGRWEVD